MGQQDSSGISMKSHFCSGDYCIHSFREGTEAFRIQASGVCELVLQILSQCIVLKLQTWRKYKHTKHQ